MKTIRLLKREDDVPVVYTDDLIPMANGILYVDDIMNTPAAYAGGCSIALNTVDFDWDVVKLADAKDNDIILIAKRKILPVEYTAIQEAYDTDYLRIVWNLLANYNLRLVTNKHDTSKWYIVNQNDQVIETFDKDMYVDIEYYVHNTLAKEKVNLS